MSAADEQLLRQILQQQEAMRVELEAFRVQAAADMKAIAKSLAESQRMVKEMQQGAVA